MNEGFVCSMIIQINERDERAREIKYQILSDYLKQK